MKPQFYEKSFETQFFCKYARIQKALLNAIAESYLQGVSTAMSRRSSHTGIDQLSLSVSRIARDLDYQVMGRIFRPIEQVFPYLFVDASYCYTVRDGPRYVLKALLMSAGVWNDVCHEINGARIVAFENKAFWSGFFDYLKERGLIDVQLVISDDHQEIQTAVATAFLGASWQICGVHRNFVIILNFHRIPAS